MKGLIDAVLSPFGAGPGQKAYFFKGGQYFRYDTSPGVDRVDAGYPMDVTAWGAELAGGIDGACHGRGAYAGHSYFCKGANYFRFKWASDALDQAARPLSDWPLPPPFSNGVDAVLDGRGAFADYTYFFKGAQYARYAWSTGTVEIKPLSNWRLPAEFALGIDAVVNGPGGVDGKAFFFRGLQYVRYDWKNDRVDGEVRLIAPNWKGLGELLLAQRGGYGPRFSHFIAGDRMNDDVADLLNALHAFPAGSWALQTAHFAHHELSAGNLLGILRADDAELLRVAVAPDGGATASLDIIRNAGGELVSANAWTVDVRLPGGVRQGFIIVNNGVMDRAEVPGADRRFAQAVIAHELTHFRNRVAVNAMDNDTVLDAARYADPASAAALPNTHWVRSRLINELTCRHVAWRVVQDIDHAGGNLVAGQLFNAACAFALAGMSPNQDYSDNGYFTGLAALIMTVPPPLPRQVALCIRDMTALSFHDDAAVNAAVHQFLQQEFAAVQPAFVPAAAVPSGLA